MPVPVPWDIYEEELIYIYVISMTSVNDLCLLRADRLFDGRSGLIGCVTLSVSHQADGMLSRHEINTDSNLCAQSGKCAEAYSQSCLH